MGDRHSDGQQEAPGARVCAEARGWRGGGARGWAWCELSLKSRLCQSLHGRANSHWVRVGALSAERSSSRSACVVKYRVYTYVRVLCARVGVVLAEACAESSELRASVWQSPTVQPPSSVRPHTHTQLHNYEAGLTRCFTVAPLALCGDVHLENAAARWPTPRRNDCERVQGV